MTRQALVAGLALMALAGCNENSANPTEPAPVAQAATAADPTPTAAAGEGEVHNVGCACTLGKACGNMIELDGNYVPLESEELGEMAFCGKTGVQAKVQGELKDGKFKATSVQVIPPKQ